MENKSVQARPWRVSTYIPGRKYPSSSYWLEGRKEFTSQVKAYADVQDLMAAIRTGSTQVVRIRIEHWNKARNSWDLYEILDRKDLGL